jgi:hypothetical protein
MVNRFVGALKDDSGFILQGGCALAFLIFMFFMALFGQISWVGFGVMLLVSFVLTGIRSLFN